MIADPQYWQSGWALPTLLVGLSIPYFRSGSVNTLLRRRVRGHAENARHLP